MDRSQPINGNFKSLFWRLVQGANKYSFIAIAIFLGCTCSVEHPEQDPEIEKIISFNVDSNQLIADLSEFTKIEHPFGSERQKELSDWIKQRAASMGLIAEVEGFSAQTPNPFLFRNPSAPADNTLSKNGYNVKATLSGSKTCNIIFASHYDTKTLEEGSYLGANDSASSSAGLFHLANIIQNLIPDENDRCSFTFYWFDGEESVLPDWNDGEENYTPPIKDNTYGSRYTASKTEKCSKGICLAGSNSPIKALIVLDMIGSPNIKITTDLNSSPRLVKLMKDSAKKLGLSKTMGSFSTAIEDDHIPFKNLGLDVLDIIDFQNTSHWHKTSDTFDKVSTQSIIEAIKIAAKIATEENSRY